MKYFGTYLKVVILVTVVAMVLSQSVDASAQPFCRMSCGDFCDRMPGSIALVTQLTGMRSNIGVGHKAGAEFALRQIIKEGGWFSLSVADGQSNVLRTLTEAKRAVGNGAKVVMGLFGYNSAQSLASDHRNVVFFDLSVRSSWTSPSPPPNLFALLWELAQSAERALRRKPNLECPNDSIELQAYMVIQLIAGAIQNSRSNKSDALIRSLRNDRFKTAAGIIRVRKDTGIFEQD